MKKWMLNLKLKEEPRTSLEALMTDVVLSHIFSMLSPNDLMRCRLVCQQWNAVSKMHLARKTIITLGEPYITEEEIGLLRFYYNAKPDGDLRSLQKAEEFLNFMNIRNTLLGIAFKTLKVRPSLVAEVIGDLLLHPRIRDDITRLDVAVYPVQLEWLKTIVEGLKNLIELNVTVVKCDRRSAKRPSPPPPGFPWQDLGLLGEVPPSLSVPQQYLEDAKYEGSVTKLELQTFRITGHDYRSFPCWIFERVPKLRHLQWGLNSKLNYSGSIEYLTQKLKVKGLKSFELIDPFRIMSLDRNNWDIVCTTNKLCLFLKNHCEGTLESLILNGNGNRIGKIFTSVSLFTLKTLRIEWTKAVDDRDFKWELKSGKKSNYIVTGKMSQQEPASDFLALLHGMNRLQTLRIQTVIQIQRNAGCKDTDNNDVLETISSSMHVVTTQRFPSVTTLHIQVKCSITERIEFERLETNVVVANLPQQLQIAFPSLVKLTIRNIYPSLVNSLLQTVHENLEYLEIFCDTDCTILVSDKDFLQNNALLRLHKLQEFEFTNDYYRLTDSVIYKGFLKLPELHTLRLLYTFSIHLRFRKRALKKLKKKLVLYEKDFTPLVLDEPKKEDPCPEVPPYHGWRTEEDSLVSCKSLEMRPSIKDFSKEAEMEKDILRFQAKFYPALQRVNDARRFTVNYYMANNMVQIFENVHQNI